MAILLSPQIQASQLAKVVPSVLGTAGQELQFDGMILDSNLGPFGYPVMPIGQVLQFADQPDVATYFGATSQEAGLASVYFLGPVNATKTPNSLIMTPYPLAAVPAYLRGGVSTLTLAQLQAVNASLTVSIDGSPITQTINLAAATSFSNAANIIGGDLAIHGIQNGQYTGSLSGTVLTVTAVIEGIQHATGTANITGGTTLTVLTNAGYIQVGDVITGAGIPAGTTISAYAGGGVPGGVGSYTLSQACTNANGISITAFSPNGNLSVGQVVTGTGLTAGTYIASLGTGTGGAGTYNLSASATTEAGETITAYAPGVVWSPAHKAFVINSGTTGTSSSVGFGSGPAATTLSLTQATGAMQSLGATATDPATFMTALLATTQNWVSFMTTWEPTDVDKEAFATWNNGENDQYVYDMWETNILDTESNGPSAPVTFIDTGLLSGTIMIYTNPLVTALAGEKAAASMGFAASLDFDRTGGRSTQAGKAFAGLQPDVINGTVAITLGGDPQTGTQGFGINFYGSYTTRSQGFPQWQRGFISGPFEWADSYLNQIWLNNGLQESVMVGLSNITSLPYNPVGYTQVEAWCLDTIAAAVNFGAIQAGVTLSQAQITEVNQQAGIQIDQVLFQRGWYLQVKPATAQARGLRISPPITFWYVDGGSIQSINIASIEVQ